MGGSFIKYITPVYSLIKYIIIISIDRIFLNIKTELIINKIWSLNKVNIVRDDSSRGFFFVLFFCLLLSFRVVKKHFHKAILFTRVVFGHWKNSLVGNLKFFF